MLHRKFPWPSSFRWREGQSLPHGYSSAAGDAIGHSRRDLSATRPLAPLQRKGDVSPCIGWRRVTKRGAWGQFPLRCGSASETLWSMVPSLQDEVAGTAVFSLGPMDGQEHPIASDTSELCVVMTDGQQHRYVRTDQVQPLPDGRLAVVFDWAGRHYGPN